MPFGDFVNSIPPVGFLAIHVALFLDRLILRLALHSAPGVTTLGWGFALFALAEISYMTYHLELDDVPVRPHDQRSPRPRRVRARVRRGQPDDPDAVDGRVPG